MNPYRTPAECDHGVIFDQATADAERLPPHEVRKRWPRLDGECPLGCGYRGIAYASMTHYLYGDY